MSLLLSVTHRDRDRDRDDRERELSSECVGLKGYNTDWWMPVSNNDIADVFYCDYCMRTQLLPNCVLNPRTSLIMPTHCSSYLLHPNKYRKIGISYISFWSSDLKQCYTIDDDLKVNLPTGKTFFVFIQSTLQTNQYFTISAYADDTAIKIFDEEKHTNIFYKKNALIKGYCSEQNFDFIYLAPPQDFNAPLTWTSISKHLKLFDKFRIKIDYYSETAFSKSNTSNKFYGEFIPRLATDGTLQIVPVDTNNYVNYISSNYSKSTVNAAIKTYSFYDAELVKENTIPFVIEFGFKSVERDVGDEETIKKVFQQYAKSVKTSKIDVFKHLNIANQHRLLEITDKMNHLKQQREEIMEATKKINDEIHLYDFIA